MTPTREPPFVGVSTSGPLDAPAGEFAARLSRLERTVRSIERGFPSGELFLLDHSPTEEGVPATRSLLGAERRCERCDGMLNGRWHFRYSARPIPTPAVGKAAGRYRLWMQMFGHVMTNLASTRSPFWVWSDDDVVWLPTAQDVLTRIWSGCPQDVWCVGGVPPGDVIGSVRIDDGLELTLHFHVPGAAWSFRNPRLVPIDAFDGADYDVQTCRSRAQHGLHAASFPLVTETQVYDLYLDEVLVGTWTMQETVDTDKRFRRYLRNDGRWCSNDMAVEGELDVSVDIPFDIDDACCTLCGRVRLEPR